VKGYKPLAGYQRSLKGYATTACNAMFTDFAINLAAGLVRIDKEDRERNL
jgi:hypothetical protein